MPDIIFQGAILNGTNNSDVLVGSDLFAAANTINGGGGNDLIYGDMRNAYIGTGGDIPERAVSLQDPFGFGGNLWSLTENRDIANATTIPHATFFLNGADQFAYFRFDLTTGQNLVIDSDYGFLSPIGGDFDSVVEIYDSLDLSNQVGYNDDDVTSAGGTGSYNGFDSFLDFTAPADGTYYVRIRQIGTTVVDTGDFAVVNFSLTGQAVAMVGQGDDLLRGGAGFDVIHGQGGSDSIFGGADDDLIFGGTGNDWLSGDAQNDVIYGDAGGDDIIGGSGFDTAYGGNGSDWISGGSGEDKSFGQADADFLQGDAGNDELYGGGASDILFGGSEADTMAGDAASDLLRGDLGADVLTGGDGADVFLYRYFSDSKVNASQRDTITDFEVGVDKIDLCNMDANRSIAGDQAFDFIGVAGFNGADSIGDVRWQVVAAGTMVAVDVNADGAGDMLILLEGTLTLSANDFIL